MYMFESIAQDPDNIEEVAWAWQIRVGTVYGF